MKHIFAVVLLVAATSFAFSQPTGGGANQKRDDEQAVRQLITDLYTALGHNDVAALDRIYASDYTLVNESGVVTKKAPRLASIKSGELKYESARFEDLSVRIYGNAAVALYRAIYKAQLKGEAIGGQSRATLTLVKNRGNWQVAAAQVTTIGGK